MALSLPFQTARCELVAVQQEAWKLFSNEELMRSYSGGSAWTRAVFDKRLENWGSGYSILHEGRLIGHLELVPGSGMTEVAMMVDQAFQGRGFAKEVLNAVLSKIKNPVGYIDRQNAKAHKLASSCGFKEENGVYKKCSGSHC